MSKYFAVFAYNLRGNGDVASVTRPEGGIGLPGGKVEKGENEIEALRRECEEEGWLIQIKDRTKPFFERETKDGNCINIVILLLKVRDGKYFCNLLRLDCYYFDDKMIFFTCEEEEEQEQEPHQSLVSSPEQVSSPYL